ncbi:hypothetical protein T492DRAFT_976611 [Pavlovales sp. CCMP2436]|nr:hypothetical protein T492DRAFT_976611 [Pavlovales sp. CCMP2436]
MRLRGCGSVRLLLSEAELHGALGELVQVVDTSADVRDMIVATAVEALSTSVKEVPFELKLEALTRWCDTHTHQDGRLTALSTMQTSWQDKWKVGSWVRNCNGKRHRVPDAYKDAFNLALARSGLGEVESFEDKVDALMRWCDDNPGKQLTGSTTTWTAWDPNWKMGMWACNCQNATDGSRVPDEYCAEFRDLLKRARYGEAPNFKDKLDALVRWCDDNSGEKLKQKTTMQTYWDDDWGVGKWINACKSSPGAVLDEYREAFEKAVVDSRYGEDAVSFATKLEALERWCAVEGRDRLMQKTTMETDWDPKDPVWKIGQWVAACARDKSGKAVPDEHRARFYKAVELSGYGTAGTFAQKLEALESWCDARPGQRLNFSMRIRTEWDDEWWPGSWISNNRPNSKACKGPPPELRERFAAAAKRSLYFQDDYFEAKLDVLERWPVDNPRERLKQKITMRTDWDPANPVWPIGQWVSSCLSSGTKVPTQFYEKFMETVKNSGYEYTSH